MFKNIRSIFIWKSGRICDVYPNIFQQKSTCIWITGDLYVLWFIGPRPVRERSQNGWLPIKEHQKPSTDQFVRQKVCDAAAYTLNQKSKSPPKNFSNISKSILPILIIQTVMDREFSYAKKWVVHVCQLMALFLWNHAFYDKRYEKKSHTFVICVRFYTNNKGITHVSIYCIIYCMSLHVFLLISVTMNEVFNNW